MKTLVGPVINLHRDLYEYLHLQEQVLLEIISVTAGQLFGDPRTYRASLDQRSYVWNAEHHWQPLWEDIRNAAEIRSQHPVGKHEHFIAVIVIQQNFLPADRLLSFGIIDGQNGAQLCKSFHAIRNLTISTFRTKLSTALHQPIENEAGNTPRTVENFVQQSGP